MTAESESWTTAQRWVFIGSYMTSTHCLCYGHEEKQLFWRKKLLKCITEPFQTTISFTWVLDFAFRCFL